MKKSRQLRLSRRSHRSKSLNLDEAGNPIKPSALEKVKTVIGVPDNASSEEFGSPVEDNDIPDKNSCDEFLTPDEDEDQVEVVENDQFYDVKSSPKIQKSRHLGKLARHPPTPIPSELCPTCPSTGHRGTGSSLGMMRG